MPISREQMRQEIRDDFVRVGISLLVGALGFLLSMWASSHLLVRLFVSLYPHDGQDGMGAWFGSIFCGLAGGILSFAGVYQYLLKNFDQANC